MQKIVIILVALFSLADVAQAQTDRVAVGHDLSREDRAAYEAEAAKRLTALDEKIKSYRRRQSTASTDVRRELVSAVKQLESQRRVVDRELKSLGRTTDHSWRRQRDQVEDAFRAADQVLRATGDEMEVAQYGEVIPETPALQQKVEALEQQIERLERDSNAKMDQILEKLEAIDRSIRSIPRTPVEP